MKYKDRRVISETNWKYALPYEKYKEVHEKLRINYLPVSKEDVFTILLDNGFEWALNFPSNYVEDETAKIAAKKPTSFKYTGPQDKLFAKPTMSAVEEVARILETSVNLIEYILISKELEPDTL